MDQEQKKDYDPQAYKPETANVSKPKGGFWRTFFIVIGIMAAVIVILIIGAVIALSIIKPFGLDVTKLPAAIINMNSDQPSSYDHPLLSTDQEKVLESLGVDTKTLPTEITPAMEDCATDALGADRVKAIKDGAAPSFSDYLKAKDCL